METLFFRPTTVEEAVDLLAKYGSSLLVVNGGTDAVLSIKEKKVAPEVIMQVSAIEGFHCIQEKDGYVEIGGGATFTEMAASPVLQNYAGLMEAIAHLASPSIRNIGTAAGNLCTAAPAADCASMLYALEAEVKLVSKKGERTVALASFYDTSASYKTVVKEDELLVSILVPALKKTEGTGYVRLSRRKAQDIAKVIIGARVAVENGKVAKASIALGALNATLVHAEETEKALVGMTPEEAVAYAKANFPKEAKLHKSYYTQYKEDVVSAALYRALDKAFQNVGGKA